MGCNVRSDSVVLQIAIARRDGRGARSKNCRSNSNLRSLNYSRREAAYFACARIVLRSYKRTQNPPEVYRSARSKEIVAPAVSLDPTQLGAYRVSRPFFTHIHLARRYTNTFTYIQAVCGECPVSRNRLTNERRLGAANGALHPS